jgi:hypothetical protein
MSTATLCADIDLAALAYAEVNNRPTSAPNTTYVLQCQAIDAQAAYDHYIWQQQMNAMSRRIDNDIKELRKMSNAKP